MSAEDTFRDLELLAAIVSSSDDAIISKTLDGIVTSWNRGAEEIFGYSADEMIGQAVAVLAAPGHEAEMVDILIRIGKGERVDHFRTQRRHKDGRILDVSLTVSPVHDASGRVIGASKIVRDVTALLRQQRELAEATARLHESNLQLLHMARLGEMGEMAAVMAHELNQPLSVINNYLQGARRLLRTNPAENIALIEHGLAEAASQANMAAALVGQLRGYARAGDSRSEPESVTSLLHDGALLAGMDRGRSGIELKVQPPEQDLFVLADRVQTLQVLTNLLRNAMEAVRGSGLRQVDLAAAPTADEMVAFTVTDTGPGIPDDLADRLFQPFVTAKQEGLGLGLSICRRIVEGCGGRIWVDRSPHAGASISFTLPIAPVKERS